jgi:hypothetical protein
LTSRTSRGSDGVYAGAGKIAGRFGQAASFPRASNASELVRLPSSAALNFGGKALTIAAWVKPDPFVNTASLRDGSGLSDIRLPGPSWLVHIRGAH